MTTPSFLRRFPRAARLYDGTEVTIRPLRPDDKAELRRFFLRVPEDDRFYLNSAVTAPETIREFADRIDFERAVPLVASDGDRILADSTLHRSRRAARRHVGELRVVVDPAFRGRGLGPRLIRELVQIGRDIGLSKLFFELVGRRESDAIQAASAAGFRRAAVLEGRVRDIYGSLQDLIIMELSPDEDEDAPHLDI